jgi:hypothetical protein
VTYGIPPSGMIRRCSGIPLIREANTWWMEILESLLVLAFPLAASIILRSAVRTYEMSNLVRATGPRWTGAWTRLIGRNRI